MKYIISLFLFASITRIGNAQDNESAHRETDRVKRMTNIKMKDTSIIDSSDIAVNEKEAISIINDEPPFGIYKDTYLITGMPLNKAINSNTADAVFQISIRHRLNFGFSSGFNVYIEVMSFRKLIEDAKMRNKIFFKKLGLE